MALADTVKKVAIWKIFLQLLKAFCDFFLAMHILYCCKNQQNVLQKKIKDWTLEVYLLTGETSSWLLLTESPKVTCARSYAWFLNFLSNGEGLDCFSRPNVLPKVVK